MTYHELFSGLSKATLDVIRHHLIREIADAHIGIHIGVDGETLNRMKMGVRRNYHAIQVIERVLLDKEAPIETDYTSAEIDDMVRLGTPSSIGRN